MIDCSGGVAIFGEADRKLGASLEVDSCHQLVLSTVFSYSPLPPGTQGGALSLANILRFLFIVVDFLWGRRFDRPSSVVVAGRSRLVWKIAK